jgi:hypothetical protein
MKDNNKIKIVTYIDRKNIISEVFINYYLKFFNHNEFHFLILNKNYDSISEYLKSKKFSEDSFEIVTNDYIGMPTLLDKQNSTVNQLISNQFLVVYVDIDEILYHHNLRKYILNFEGDYIVAKGLVIIPNDDEEIIDDNKSILSQRKNCVIDDEYHSKVCILKSKFEWTGGRHNKNGNKTFNDIYLIDIGKCCPKIMLENNTVSNQLYKNKTERYSVTDENHIQNILNGWRKSLIKIPEYITDTNLF